MAIDYRNWHLGLGRRFRSLKLWFVLRSFGAEGFRKHIRRVRHIFFSFFVYDQGLPPFNQGHRAQ